MIMAYNWYIFNSSKYFEDSIRQGVITAENEEKARLYLMSTFEEEEIKMLHNKKNILVVSLIHSWEN